MMTKILHAVRDFWRLLKTPALTADDRLGKFAMVLGALVFIGQIVFIIGWTVHWAL